MLLVEGTELARAHTDKERVRREIEDVKRKSICLGPIVQLGYGTSELQESGKEGKRA